MKQATTFLLSACFLLAAAHLPGVRADDVITFKSGEKFPGEPDTLEDRYLKVRSRILATPVDVKLEELDQLSSSRPLTVPEQFSFIKLANGDEFYGTLKGLDAECLQLETIWGGLVAINRNHVRHIGFDSQKTYIRNATESLQGWEPMGNSMLPECRNGYWIMRGANTTELQTTCPLPSKIHVQFSIYHTNYKVMLSLWGDSDFQNRIFLDLSQEKVELSKYGSGAPRTIGRVKRTTERNWYNDKTVKRSDVHFYADREKGNYYLYVNGEQIARWEELRELENIVENEVEDGEQEGGESPRPHEFKPGNRISLAGYDALNMAMCNLNVFGWNGAQPCLEKEQDTVSKYDQDAPKDRVLLVNGDVLRGDISLLEDGRIRIRSPHYDVTVPTARVRSLDQKGAEDKKIPEDHSDIRAFLTDQSIISLTMEGMRNGFLEGRSPAAGKIRIPLESVRKVLFNLQNPELRKQRETPFLTK